MRRIILGIAVMAAFILVVGSIGAFEQANIGFMQCLIQCVIGAGLAWFALKKIEM